MYLYTVALAHHICLVVPLLPTKHVEHSAFIKTKFGDIIPV